LVRLGYLARSARGRIATASAYQLLGKSVPAQQVLDITE
jgi:Holliday junction resolvasome RuvABC ATP-dependent DNA helicase subunit